MLNTKKIMVLAVLLSMLLDPIAFASNPQLYSANRMGSKYRILAQNLIEKRSEKFNALSVEKQQHMISKADNRLTKLIAKVSKWSDEKYEQRQKMAEMFLSGAGEQSLMDDDGPLPTPEAESVRLSVVEIDYLSGSAEENKALEDSKSAEDSAPARRQTRIEFLNQLLELQKVIKSAKIDLSSKHKANRVIASVAAFIVPAALLLVLGLTLMAMGIAITVGTLGLAAVIGIPLVVIGCVCIASSFIPVIILIAKGNFVGP